MRDALVAEVLVGEELVDNALASVVKALAADVADAVEDVVEASLGVVLMASVAEASIICGGIVGCFYAMAETSGRSWLTMRWRRWSRRWWRMWWTR